MRRLPNSLDAFPALIALESEMPDESRQEKFEEVYPKFEFAPLVRFALELAEWINRRFARTTGSQDGAHKDEESVATV